MKRPLRAVSPSCREGTPQRQQSGIAPARRTPNAVNASAPPRTPPTYASPSRRSRPAGLTGSGASRAAPILHSDRPRRADPSMPASRTLRARSLSTPPRVIMQSAADYGKPGGRQGRARCGGDAGESPAQEAV